MAAYRPVDGFKSPAGCLPVHRDQRRAQRSRTSRGKLRVFTPQNIRRCTDIFTVQGRREIGPVAGDD